MPKVDLPSDLANVIAKSLDVTDKWVDEWFNVEEDKMGFFVATLKPKKSLEINQFRIICRLVRDLGGEAYLGMKAWRVPGPLAKIAQHNIASALKPHDVSSKPEPGGVTPHVVSMDKSKVYITVPIKTLLSMPFQSRTSKDPEIEELAESIKAYGILEPILVRPKPDGLFEIVAGERRVKAADKAGLIEVPVIIKFLSDQEAYECELIENVQRKDLADIEKARMLDYMIKKFSCLQKDLAQKLGKTEGWVSQHLAMLKIEELYPGKVEVGKLTERQAREILSAPAEKRKEILDRARQSGELPSASEIRSAVQPEAQAATLPSTEEEHVEPPKPEPLLTGFDWTCPECGKKFIVNHVDYSGSHMHDHVLEECGE